MKTNVQYPITNYQFPSPPLSSVFRVPTPYYLLPSVALSAGFQPTDLRLPTSGRWTFDSDISRTVLLLNIFYGTKVFPYFADKYKDG